MLGFSQFGQDMQQNPVLVSVAKIAGVEYVVFDLYPSHYCPHHALSDSAIPRSVHINEIPWEELYSPLMIRASSWLTHSVNQWKNLGIPYF